MKLEEFAAQVPGFHGLPHYDKIEHIAWYLHESQKVASFGTEHMRAAYNTLYLEPPDMSVYLPRMVRKKILLPAGTRSYKLEGSHRQALSAKYGLTPTTITVDAMLAGLPAKMPTLNEREFLAEALKCYRVQAFRATVVMTWNLAFDHMTNCILSDPKRVADFNAGIKSAYPTKKNVINNVGDFADLKESEVLQICRTAKLIDKNVYGILDEKLDKRNRAAHPSNVVVNQHTANDVINDLVNNVVLKLT
jgi:hypothetical protein